MAGNIPLTSPTAAQDQDGNEQRHRVDHQPDIAGLGVFRHGAVKRQSADRERDSVGEDDSEDSAYECDGESFGQKLQEDVPAARAERFLDSNLARALRHRDQHDVHEADAADSKSQSADEAQQNLQADRDDFELVDLLHQVEDQKRRGGRRD